MAINEIYTIDDNMREKRIKELKKRGKFKTKEEEKILRAIVNKEEKELKSENFLEVYNKVEELMNTCYFKEDICKVIADIRNTYVAHGSITYDLAQKITFYLIDIVFAIIEEFLKLDITIEDNEKIKGIFKEDILAIQRNKEDLLFLYSNTEVKKMDNEEEDLYSERLNYDTGIRNVIDKKIIFNIEGRFLKEEIERNLGEKKIG